MGLSDGLSLDNSNLWTKNVMPLPISHTSIGQSVDIKWVKPTMGMFVVDIICLCAVHMCFIATGNHHAQCWKIKQPWRVGKYLEVITFSLIFKFLRLSGALDHLHYANFIELHGSGPLSIYKSTPHVHRISGSKSALGMNACEKWKCPCEQGV